MAAEPDATPDAEQSRRSLGALIAYEALRFREARARIRSGGGSTRCPEPPPGRIV